MTGQVWHSYDFATHYFFASHYERAWWSLWEPRWFEGFSVASYPPLTHQLTALLGWVLGIGNAIGVLTCAAVACLPLSVYVLARRYVGSQAALRSATLAVVIPSVLLAAYTFGQLPTILAMNAALLAAASLGWYLERGGVVRLALLAILVGITVAAHHATFIFFGPPLFICVILAEYLASASCRQTVRRVVEAIVAIAPVVVFTIAPFWIWHATDYVAQTPIDHLSRHDYLTDLAAQKVFFWDEHGVLLVAFGIAIPLVLRRPRQLGPWYALSLVLTVIGLGGTTPLPRILFGDQWNWLTYDRFSLWADIGMVIVLGAVASHFLDRAKPPRLVPRFAWGITLVGLAIYGLADALRPTLIAATPAPIDPRPIASFLKSDGNDRWRYLTLGFGEQSGVLNALTDAGTVDGYFFTARTLPLLTKSGIGLIDRNLDLDPEAAVTRVLLERPATHRLRWVFTKDPHYEPYVINAGWHLRATLSNGIGVWEAPVSVPEVDAIRPDERSPLSTILRYWWGIVPLGTLLSVVPLSWLAWRRRDC